MGTGAVLLGCLVGPCWDETVWVSLFTTCSKQFYTGHRSASLPPVKFYTGHRPASLPPAKPPKLPSRKHGRSKHGNSNFRTPFVSVDSAEGLSLGWVDWVWSGDEGSWGRDMAGRYSGRSGRKGPLEGRGVGRGVQGRGEGG